MGFGVLAALKPIIPLSVILIGILLTIRAVAGKLEWTLMLLVVLLPLRNVVEKLHNYPLGKDLIDFLSSE